jgi:hypothetical protein
MPALQWGPPQPPPYGYGQPPTGWAKPRIDRSLLRPKAGWYAAAAIPVALGVAATAIFVVLAVRAFPDRPKEFFAPGTVTVDAGEDQTIYFHTRESFREPAADPERPECRVTWLEHDSPIRVRHAGKLTLTLGEDQYVAEFDFDVRQRGHYRVRCSQPPNVDGYPLAVGERAHLARFGLSIVAAIGSFVLGLLFCGGVIAFVAIRRHSHKRRLEREAAGWA